MLIKRDVFRCLDCNGRAMLFCIIPSVNRELKQCRRRMQINNAQSVNAIYSAFPSEQQNESREERIEGKESKEQI